MAIYTFCFTPSTNDLTCHSTTSEFCFQGHGFSTVDVSGNSFTVNLHEFQHSTPSFTQTFTKAPTVGPAVSLSTPTAFANQVINTTSAAKAVTLSNTGNA